ncbi:MAG: hypothetical protein P8013_11375 [Candidatus Sulfobium sp.]|jgi:hypothetical protein
MKRLMYLLLAGVMVVGFTAAQTERAEAMDSGSAALLAGTVAVIGGAVVYAAALDADHHRPVYVESRPSVTYYREVYRPARTRVIYVRPGHRDCFPDRDRYRHRGWDRNDRGWRHGFGR